MVDVRTWSYAMATRVNKRETIGASMAKEHQAF